AHVAYERPQDGVGVQPAVEVPALANLDLPVVGGPVPKRPDLREIVTHPRPSAGTHTHRTFPLISGSLDSTCITAHPRRWSISASQFQRPAPQLSVPNPKGVPGVHPGFDTQVHPPH